MDIALSSVIAGVFSPIHRAIRNKTHDQFWIKGGRGSTKSSFAAAEVILGIVQDPLAHAIVFRKVSDTIRNSTYPTLLWAIDKMQLSMFFRATIKPAVITYIPTGQQIILKGLDDPIKLKSIKTQFGYFKYLWFEEGAEYDGMEEIRNVEQSVLRGGEEFIEIVTYNPPKEECHWINTHVREVELVKDKRKYVHYSSYHDVPRKWLGKKFFDDAEELKRNNYNLFLNEYMGETVGNSDVLVFSGRWESMEFDTGNLGDPLFGADWGFSQDPTALVKCYVHDGILYISHEAVALGCEIVETPALFDTIPDVRKHKIEADSARPETISHMRRQGFNIVGVEKWKGSVEDGITHMLGYRKIIIHSRCKHTINEFKKYQYKIHKLTKSILTDILDENNHCIDAIRYALSKLIKRKKQGGFVVL